MRFYAAEGVFPVPVCVLEQTPVGRARGDDMSLKELKERDQEKAFELAKDVFRIRYSESDVVYEHVHSPKEVVESWHDCLVIGEQLVRMFNEACGR